jgi:hypothetical protein
MPGNRAEEICSHLRGRGAWGKENLTFFSNGKEEDDETPYDCLIFNFGHLYIWLRSLNRSGAALPQSAHPTRHPHDSWFAIIVNVINK